MATVAPDGVPQRILIVEDQDDTRDAIQQLLQLSLQVPIDTAANGQVALELLEKADYSIVLTDLRMPKMGGMKLFEEIQARKLSPTVIVTTGHGGVSEAVQAMRMGAYDFLTKPAEPQYLILLMQRVLQERAMRDELLALRSELAARNSFQNVLTKSPKMIEVFELITNIAETNSTVLILGETGTGKEQLARAIHQASAPRRSGAFVAINCAALPETLLESELFGHEKGSFTGAVGQRKGRFEQAHHGTLFLDEVGDIPPSMQVKLLRVLQERRIERLGGSEPIDIDVRVIGATHQPLEKLVKEGKFREDLFYRLNVIRIELPALRERPEDVPILAAHFCEKFARPGTTPPRVSPEAMALLTAHPWPGNVRQLENAIERACVTVRDDQVLPKHLPSDVVRPIGARSMLQVDLSRPLAEQVHELTAKFEERYIRKALKRTRGHVGKCAKITGLSRRSITDKIAIYKINKDDFKGDNTSDE